MQVSPKKEHPPLPTGSKNTLPQHASKAIISIERKIRHQCQKEQLSAIIRHQGRLILGKRVSFCNLIISNKIFQIWN